MVLDHLRREMPRASFETWVQPAEFVSLEEGVFSIGTYNPYGRDWLESRLQKTVEQYLRGLLGRPVEVQFVALDDLCDCDDQKDEHEQQPADRAGGEADLQILHESVRNALIAPERVVKLPVYFLRWLPYVDAETLFLVLALRQEYYLATAGKGSASGKVTARAERVCRWAGISRAQFFRLLQPGSGFEWFGTKSATDYEIDRRTGRTKKSANQYSLYGIPITPGDAEDLRQFLLEQGVRTDPHKALLAALAAQPGQILQYPVRAQGKNDVALLPKKQTIQDVVWEVVGQKLSPDLIDLADRLSDHLLTPNEFILVSWYFLQHWLPLLGANAAMLVLMLRSACYFNDATGELRDEVWIEGGYETLTRRLGIENPRQIAHWFPAAIERGRRKVSRTAATQQELDRRAQFQERMGAFVERIDHRPAGNGSYSWKFKVRRSDPLTPEHEQIYQEVVRLIADLDREGLLDELMAQIEPQSNDCPETHENQPTVVLRRSNFLNDCSATLRQKLNDCLATIERAEKDCFETLLKSSKSL